VGDAVLLHNLHNRDRGIQYAMGKDLQSDVRSVHLMHNSVDTACYGG